MNSSPGPRSVRGVDDEQHASAEDEGVGRVPHHGGVHPVLGPVDPGRVDERDLGARPPRHAQDALAGGLGLVGDDRDLLAHERVDERGLAGVGPADDGDLADLHTPAALRPEPSGGRPAAPTAAPTGSIRTRWTRRRSASSTVNRRSDSA